MPTVDELLEKIPLSRPAVAALIAVPLLMLLTFKLSTPPDTANTEEYSGGIGGQERKKSVEASLASLSITDSGLLACIEDRARDRATLPANIPGSISDVHQLEMLYCRNKSIVSLEGLGALRNLRYLDINNNNVRSLAPLAGHPRLNTLHVRGNPLSDTRFVKTLPALKQLQLPDLDGVECLDIATQLQGLKTNYFSIACEGPKRKNETASKTSKRKVEAEKQYGEDETLTDSQQRELFEFEREMRYSQ